jgi:hypothetical protein
MKTPDLNINLIAMYFELLKNLSIDSKLELITKLSNSMKTKKQKKNSSLRSLYGAFESEQSADEIISDIRQSRVFTSKRAKF